MSVRAESQMKARQKLGFGGQSGEKWVKVVDFGGKWSKVVHEVKIGGF